MIFSLLFSFLLFTSKGFFFFLMDFYLLFTNRFSFWFLRVFLIFPSCEAQMFLLMFLVSPFDVLSILIEHIVFYRFVIGGPLMRRSLSFPTSFAIHIFCFRIFTVIFSPIQGFFGTKIVTSSNWHVSTVGEALRRYRRGHGLKSRKSLNSFFFRSYFHYCSCSVHHCEVRFHSRSARDGELSHVGSVQTIPRISSNTFIANLF